VDPSGTAAAAGLQGVQAPSNRHECGSAVPAERESTEMWNLL